MDFYHYPPDKKISPFAPIHADNYFVYGTKFSYLGNFEEIGNISSPMDKRNDFFTGAWVVNICKRFVIVENGTKIFQNKNFDDGHVMGTNRYKKIQFMIVTNVLWEYAIPSWQTHTLRTYAIQDDKNPLQLKLFATSDFAIQYAIALSKKWHIKCIVAQWFADIDRH